MSEYIPSSRSQRLTLSDSRAVFRLIGEICELGASPQIWQKHMLDRLNEMTDSKMSMSIQSRMPMISPVLQTIVNMVESGFGVRGMQLMDRYIFGGGALKDPCTMANANAFAAGRWFTLRRRDLVPDDSIWYGSDFFSEYCAPMGIDDTMGSNIFLPQMQGAHSLNFRRDAKDRRPYSERERRRVQLFHLELGRLWFKPRAQDVQSNHLPLRLRQTLGLLHKGDSEKQIAAKMMLSPHTVHDNMKRLREHFDATNRAALMAATASGEPAAPRLVN